ncbi:MAG: SDR family oxidoreductase [Rhodospirillaceae bacterium]|nr:SDR family oxidoreductase [Rhodospirillaceae bacterium]MBT5300224.1 SDR family oxidoreductase [Rhodospirillaceae bacterium]MBT5516021.1 SDR family oxidoreductase [Rhodospirillaceae bacterium]MBT6085499.1 SDR family oxidoreductase [Rhodospirillaceae bacterium]MBT6610355.1 SDR family oxidoreductase [Rhodospirillaceae bacterium]
MDVRMDGRNAIITGGSAGLGKAIATQYVASGANVAIVARRQETLDQAKAEISAAGDGKVVTVAADIRLAEDCQRAVAEAEAGLGGIDILVNNAGTSQRGPFLEVSDELWQDDLDLKLFASIRLCRLVIPGMRERHWGRIINVLNVGAKTPPAEGAPTAVSRAAGMALMKVLANEGAPHNVLVNGMLVGKIRSEQWERRHAADPRDITLEEWYAEAGQEQPMGRLGLAEEFANMACFLASDAGSYVNGAAINVDGGLCKAV